MSRLTSRWVLAAVLLAVLAAFATVLAGLGTRWGWWQFRAGFSVLRWGVLIGIAAALTSVFAVVMTRPGSGRGGFVPAILGLAVTIVVIGIPGSWLLQARRVPPIHDVTTDTENPPRFIAILPLRRDAPNPVEYGGPEVAALQRAGYPKLGPVMLSVPPLQAFERALAAARDMCWMIVEANPDEGRIEATATTFWFGFKDDVVVRVAPAAGGSRIDLRSVSRVGRSDVGTNARRIRKYLDQLTAP